MPCCQFSEGGREDWRAEGLASWDTAAGYDSTPGCCREDPNEVDSPLPDSALRWNPEKLGKVGTQGYETDLRHCEQPNITQPPKLGDNAGNNTR